eukprot:1266996-Rhodomonas_salina.3
MKRPESGSSGRISGMNTPTPRFSGTHACGGMELKTGAIAGDCGDRQSEVLASCTRGRTTSRPAAEPRCPERLGWTILVGVALVSPRRCKTISCDELGRGVPVAAPYMLDPPRTRLDIGTPLFPAAASNAALGNPRRGDPRRGRSEASPHRDAGLLPSSGVGLASKPPLSQPPSREGRRLRCGQGWGRRDLLGRGRADCAARASGRRGGARGTRRGSVRQGVAAGGWLACCSGSPTTPPAPSAQGPRPRMGDPALPAQAFLPRGSPSLGLVLPDLSARSRPAEASGAEGNQGVGPTRSRCFESPPLSKSRMPRLFRTLLCQT